MIQERLFAACRDDPQQRPPRRLPRRRRPCGDPRRDRRGAGGSGPPTRRAGPGRRVVVEPARPRTWVRLVLGGGDARRRADHRASTPSPRPMPRTSSGRRCPATPPSPLMYGLGWNVETDRFGSLRWAHSGAFSAGASTTAVLLPEAQPGRRRADERDAAGRAGDRRRRDRRPDRHRRVDPGLARRSGTTTVLALLRRVRPGRAAADPGARRSPTTPISAPTPTRTTATPRSSTRTGVSPWSSGRTSSRWR